MLVSFNISAEEPFKDFFGEWCVVKMDTFRGSIIPEEEAKNWLGTKVLISKNEFSSLSSVIYNPIYKLTVENFADHEEGNIRQKDSVFYGVYPDRKLVKKIEVYENKDEEDPYTYIEIVNSNKIFELYDGYVFTYERSCS
ncbi:hypothetical protein [Microbulbifer pacificus]|uniref:Lipocalin-like domain-containing protein n=1 Tax=Microbulbifer pacificus TaxID=407164 RepID=A0AAU0N1D9_9GAMM|nr:hypothetical protein [Microbulbifer pacificus]WOX06139.1 hypothetical protein R5R33_03100 [Microbulbifer pacificus]